MQNAQLSPKAHGLPGPGSGGRHSMCVDLASATCLSVHADYPYPVSGSPASTLDWSLRSRPVGSRTPAQVPTLAFTPVFLHSPSSTRLSPSDAAPVHSYSSQLASRAPRTQTSSRPTGQFHIFRKSAPVGKTGRGGQGRLLPAAPTLGGRGAQRVEGRPVCIHWKNCLMFLIWVAAGREAGSWEGSDLSPQLGSGTLQAMSLVRARVTLKP